MSSSVCRLTPSTSHLTHYSRISSYYSMSPPAKKSRVTFQETQKILEENDLVDSEAEEFKQICDNSFLFHLTNLWIDQKTMKVILPILSRILLALKLETLFEVKRVVQVVNGCMRRAMKELCQKQPNKERLHNMSLEKFLEHLSSDESFTTLFEDPIPEKFQKLLYQTHTLELQTSASSSATEKTTTTSCTIAPTVPTAADVPDFEKSLDPDLSGEDELFGEGTSVRSISKISFRMQKKTNEKLITRSAEETSGFEVVKLDAMPFKKCSISDKRDWWRHASRRIQFVTSSDADPLQIHLKAILKILNHYMMSKKDKQREEKEVGSKFG